MRRDSVRIRALACAAVVVAVIAVYAQTRHFEFLAWDDQGYVSNSKMVRQGLTWEGARWAFTTTHVGVWTPLSWLSHMAAVQLFGLEPGAHHLANVAIHAATALVLLLTLASMTGSLPIAAGVSLLFAAHPLHVESVAWISERKDVLSGLFLAAALALHLRYARRPSLRRSLPLAGAFLLGLLAKPMLVTLPLLLLCLDWWPLGRLATRKDAARCALEKVPLALVAAADAVWTVTWQSRLGETRSLAELPLAARAANALSSVGAYLGDALLPSGLSPFYPFAAGIPVWRWGGAALIGVAISGVAWRERRRVPSLATGWLWLLIGLLPVIGLVQVGSQARADRYAYLPMLGVYLGVCAAAARLVSGASRLARAAVAAAAATALVAFGAAAARQAGYWRTTATLFGRAAAVNPENWKAHEMLGNDLVSRGELAAALPHYEALERLHPDAAGASAFQLGALAVRLGLAAKAEGPLRRAVQASPGWAAAHGELATTLATLGHQGEAAGEFRAALALRPAAWDMHYNLAQLLWSQGHTGEALAHFEEAARLEPGSPEAWNALGALLCQLQRFDGAEAAFERALALRPGDSGTLTSLRLCRQSAAAGTPAATLRGRPSRSPRR